MQICQSALQVGHWGLRGVETSEIHDRYSQIPICQSAYRKVTEDFEELRQLSYMFAEARYTLDSQQWGLWGVEADEVYARLSQVQTYQSSPHVDREGLWCGVRWNQLKTCSARLGRTLSAGTTGRPLRASRCLGEWDTGESCQSSLQVYKCGLRGGVKGSKWHVQSDTKLAIDCKTLGSLRKSWRESQICSSGPGTMLYQSALLVGLGVENWVSLTMLAVENVTVSGLRKIRPVVSVFVSRWVF